MKNIDKQTAERFKQLERKRKRRKKKKRKEKKIETIGKRNIELGRDTRGGKKKEENQHMTTHYKAKTFLVWKWDLCLLFLDEENIVR